MSCFQLMLHLKAFFKNQPRIKQQLALMYKRRFQHTIFYDTCASTLRYITRDQGNPEGVDKGEEEDEEPFQRKSTRKSVQSISHYENAAINFSQLGGGGSTDRNSSHSNHSSQSQPMPNTLSFMSINEKQELLKELIEKSYVFIDLSDLFTGEDLQAYENIVRQEIFEGEESIVESILETTTNTKKKGIKNKLKYFDTEALHLLNLYVSFCNKMTLKLQPSQQNDRKPSKDVFISRLILQLKARLQLAFPSQKINGKYSQLNKLVDQYKIMNDIILSTLQKTQSITIIPENSHQYAENFFTYPNISTLVSVILFMDENFLKAMFERFLEGLKVCIGRMGEKLVVMEKKFLEQLKSEYFGMPIKRSLSAKQSIEDLFTYKSNLQKIMQSSQQERFPYFRKSLRTLQTLTTQKQPIKCLKIIYQLNKTIEKQHTEFINSLIMQEVQLQENGESTIERSQQMRKSQKSKKFSFSRETELLIIEFLLARKKDNLRFIVTNIMVTHFFVHPSQLKDKKGSCLAPFVDIIKNLGFGLDLQ